MELLDVVRWEQCWRGLLRRILRHFSEDQLEGGIEGSSAVSGYRFYHPSSEPGTPGM